MEKFRGQVNANRGRVEFRLDETYDLLPEDRLRYSGRRRASGGGDDTTSSVQNRQQPIKPKGPREQEEIEIIEID